MPEYDEWGSGVTGSPTVTESGPDTRFDAHQAPDPDPDPDPAPGEAAPGEAAPGEATASGVDPALVAAVQSLLFVSDEGLNEQRLAVAIEQTVESTRAALMVLQARLLEPGSGIIIREHASGWRLTTAPECAPVLERFVIDGHSARLSPAALETLAVVAYQQPVSRGRIAAIRGVAVDGVMRTLVARGLIEEVGAETSGALLYATTNLFMDKLGVKSLTELPELAPLLPDIETLDGFDDRPPAAPAGLVPPGPTTAEGAAGKALASGSVEEEGVVQAVTPPTSIINGSSRPGGAPPGGDLPEGHSPEGDSPEGDSPEGDSPEADPETEDTLGLDPI